LHDRGFNHLARLFNGIVLLKLSALNLVLWDKDFGGLLSFFLKHMIFLIFFLF
jgi:hypothetical protein